VERSVTGLLEGEGTDELGEIIVDADELEEKAEELDRELYERGTEDGYLFGTVLDSIVRTTEYGVNITEAGLQVSMRGTDGR
jgi:hypothetical protein